MRLYLTHAPITWDSRFGSAWGHGELQVCELQLTVWSLEVFSDGLVSVFRLRGFGLKLPLHCLTCAGQCGVESRTRPAAVQPRNVPRSMVLPCHTQNHPKRLLLKAS